MVASTAPTSKIACARAWAEPLGRNTWASHPSRCAAQATPRPWFPSVVVTKTSLCKRSCNSGFCNSEKAMSPGRPKAWAAARLRA